MSREVSRPTAEAYPSRTIWERRLTKFNAAGTFLMQIGKSGLQHAVPATVQGFTNVVVDASGNIWATDWARHPVAVRLDRPIRQAVVWSTPTMARRTTSSTRPSGWRSTPQSIRGDTCDRRIQSSGRMERISLGYRGRPVRTMRTSMNRDTSSLTAMVGFMSLTVATIGCRFLISPGSHGQLHRIPRGQRSFRVRQRSPEHSLWRCSRYQPRTYLCRRCLQLADPGFRLRHASLAGTLADSSFTEDVAVDASGNLYISKPWGGNTSLSSSIPRSLSSQRYGTEGVPYLTDAMHYYQPSGVGSQRMEFVCLEAYGRRLTKLSSDGTAQWSIGEPGNWGGDNNHFSYPCYRSRLSRSGVRRG